MKKWFTRLAEVPGGIYAGHPKIDRTRLAGHALKPTVDSWKESGGKREQFFMWGNTSASPAQEHYPGPRTGEVTSTLIVRRVLEALELPGMLDDYHFVLESGQRDLWEYRRSEARVLPAIEQLCLIDVRLVEAFPKLYNSQGLEHPPSLACFETLVKLYSRDGHLNEALDFAQRAERLGSILYGGEKSFILRARILAMKSGQENLF